MSVLKLPPLHLVTSDDELHPQMSHIQIEQFRATATNGYAIASLDLNGYIDPVYAQVLEGKTLHRDSWRTISKVPVDALTFDEEGVTFQNEGTTVFISYGKTQTSLFNWTAVMPSEPKHEPNPDAFQVVGINAKQYHNLCKALHVDLLTFSRIAGSQGILIACTDDGHVAGLMPIAATVTAKGILDDINSMIQHLRQ